MGKKRNSLSIKQNNRNRKDFIDYDYANKLSPKDLQFLKTFTEEYYGGDFQRNDTYIIENGKYIQISGNKDKSLNRDLRKYVSVTKYYKDSEGNFSSDSDNKYKDSVLHKDNQLKRELWTSNNHRNRDVMSSGFVSDNESNTLHLTVLANVEGFDLTKFADIRNDLITLLVINDIDIDCDISDEDLIDLVSDMIKSKSQRHKNYALIDQINEIIST